MEPPRGRPLTPQEKAQLQKKLIVLKKEYSRTFHRLQRAERVEKVKNYVRKTVAEQNLLLMQGEAEKDNTESIRPATHKASGEVRFGPCSTVSSTRATSVTFNPEPELFGQEDAFLQSSGSRCPSKDRGEPCVSLGASVPDKKRTKLSRRRKAKVPGEAALAVEEREASSVPEIFQRNVVCQPEPRVPSADGSQSPVFQRRSGGKILEADGRSLTGTRGGGGGGGIRDIYPAVLQPTSSQDRPGGNLSPGLPHPVPRDLSQESRGASFGHPREAGALGSAERGSPEIAVSPADFQDEGGEEEKEMPCGQGGEEGRLPLTDSGATRGLAQQAGERRVQGKTGEEEEENLGCPKAGSSPRRRSKAKDFGDQRGAGSPLLEGTPPTAPLKNAMDSCTVVEGLLFPVEYYVRTTRRMSSCQREVNLEAVIQSQLGRSRRGQRAAPGRGKGAASASFSPPEVAAEEEKGGPFPACDAMWGAPSSPSQPASSSPQAGGSVSLSGGLGESQEPPRRRGRSSHRATTAGLPRGKNGNGHEEGKAAGGPARAGGGNGEPKQRGRESLRAESDATPNSSLPEPALGLSDRGMEGSSEETQLPEGAGESSQAGPKRDEASLPPGFAASALGVRGEEDKASLLKWLPSNLDLQEFCLPEDEFGLLKVEKCKAFPATPSLEAPEAGELAEGLPCAGVTGPDPALAGGETGRAGPAFAGKGAVGPPPLFPPPHLAREDFASSELLLSPALAGGSCPQGSQLPTPAFPLVGATPASQRLPPSQTWPEALSASPSLETPIAAREPGPLGEASSLPGSDSRVLGSHGQEPVGEALNLEGQGSEPLWHSGGSPAQIEMRAEEPTEEAQEEEGRLQMTSKLKCVSGSSLVDVSTIWWEAASGLTELCLLTAGKTTLSLWRRLDPGRWEAACTWHFTKVPVIQLVHLPGVCSLACVALGSLEVEELWFLVPSSEAGGAKQSLAKAGGLKAVLGLQHRRLVTSCGSPQAQEVEVTCFSEVGRTLQRRTLMSPEETLKAFAEVDGMQDALLGMTATDRVLVWNVTSGQLLRRISVGSPSDPAASVCHRRAFADSGLLFVVLSHPHANENESQGSPAFRVVALNPKTAKSTGVVALSLPPGTGGRYVEGEVRGTSAAAVLTSGSIAVWDVLLGQCTAVLPPSSEGNWSLVRWSVADACLLAGQDNGSLCVYTYTAGLQAA